MFVTCSSGVACVCPSLILLVWVVAVIVVETRSIVPIFDSIVLSEFNILLVEVDMSVVEVWDVEKGFTETGTSVLVFSGIIVDFAAVNTVDTTVWNVTNGKDTFVVSLDTVVDALEVLVVKLSFGVGDVEIKCGVFCVVDVGEATFTVDFDVLDDVVEPTLTVEITSCPVDFVVLDGVVRVDIDAKDVVDNKSLVIDVGIGVVVGDLDFISFVDSVVAEM